MKLIWTMMVVGGLLAYGLSQGNIYAASASAAVFGLLSTLLLWKYLV